MCEGVDVAFVWVLVDMQINYAVTLLNLAYFNYRKMILTPPFAVGNLTPFPFKSK